MCLNMYVLFCLHLRKIIVELMSLTVSNLQATEPRNLNNGVQTSTSWFKRVVDCIKWMQQKAFSLLLTCQLEECKTYWSSGLDILENINCWPQWERMPAKANPF